MIVAALIIAALICLGLPAAIVAALVHNDRDSRRAEYGNDLA
jgi:hypothetical protein